MQYQVGDVEEGQWGSEGPIGQTEAAQVGQEKLFSRLCDHLILGLDERVPYLITNLYLWQ